MGIHADDLEWREIQAYLAQKTDRDLTEIRVWWVSCPKFTCLVQVTNHKIIGGAPIIKKWIGKEFEDLLVECQADRLSLLKVESSDEITTGGRKK